MTIRHLKTFIVVAKLKSISKAALELNVAQPAVSQTIKELEEHYGVSLFKRINKRIFITPEGEMLCQKAREIIKNFEEFQSLARDKEAHPSVVFGVSLTIAGTYLSQIIKQIKEKFPNISLKIKVNNALKIQNDIQNGVIDFGIIEGIPSLISMGYDVLSKDQLVVVASKENKIEEEISVDDLLKYPLLLREKGSFSRDYVTNTMRIELDPMLESNSNQAIISSCIDGVGLAILSKKIINKYIKNKKLKIIKIKGQTNDIQSSLIYFKNREFTHIFISIINEVKEIIKVANK